MHIMEKYIIRENMLLDKVPDKQTSTILASYHCCCCPVTPMWSIWPDSYHYHYKFIYLVC
jgi:hypothetical protein